MTQMSVTDFILNDDEFKLKISTFNAIFTINMPIYHIELEQNIQDIDIILNYNDLQILILHNVLCKYKHTDTQRKIIKNNIMTKLINFVNSTEIGNYFKMNISRQNLMKCFRKQINKSMKILCDGDKKVLIQFYSSIKGYVLLKSFKKLQSIIMKDLYETYDYDFNVIMYTFKKNLLYDTDSISDAIQNYGTYLEKREIYDEELKYAIDRYERFGWVHDVNYVG